MRKAPVQERAQRTVEAIFQATTLLVAQDGLEALTTNKIAQKAGVSVGTLYQYFPSKEAVLHAMIREERERVLTKMQAVLQDAVAGRIDPHTAVRLRMRAIIEAFGLGTNLGRELVRMAWQTMDYMEAIVPAQQQSADHIAIAWAQLADQGMRAPTPASVFVATRAVLGVVRAASLESSPLLGTQAFEDEMVRMVWGAIQA